MPSRIQAVGFVLVLMASLGTTAVQAETGTVDTGKTSVKLSQDSAGATKPLGRMRILADIHSPDAIRNRLL